MWKWPLRLLCGIAIAAVFYVGFVFVSGSTVALFPTPGHIILENHGSEPIREANIEILGKGYLLRGIEPEKTVTFDFSFRGSGGYWLSVSFRSGRTLIMDVRNLDPSAEVTDTLAVNDEGIRVTTTCVKKSSSEPICTHPETR